MKLFDWFFATGAGHWVLNSMTLRQFLALSLFAILVVLALIKITVDTLKTVNWRFVGREIRNFRGFGKPATWN